MTVAQPHGGLSLSESDVQDVRPIRRAIPGWSIVVAIYLGSRLLTTGILALVYWVAAIFGWPFADSGSRPDLIGLMGAWDGRFYRQIAMVGYPSQLPLDLHGHVESNAWAFLPVYPWLTRVLMNATGMDFTSAGVLLSLLAAAAAALLLYRLLLPRIGRTASLWSVAFFCVGPVSFVLQAAYADALFVALIFASLLALQAKRYLLMVPFGVVAAFTHPGALPLAAAIGILFIAGLVRREHIRWTERLRMIVAAAIIAAAGFAWPFVATAVTGFKSAYFDTEISWWTGYVGRVDLIPFTPWFVMSDTYLGIAGIVLVILVLAGFVVWLSHRGMRVLGDDLLAFAGSYGAYLVAVFLPQQSLVRVVLPLAPLLGTPALTRSPIVQRVALAVFIASQPVAIVFLWFLGPP